MTERFGGSRTTESNKSRKKTWNEKRLRARRSLDKKYEFVSAADASRLRSSISRSFSDGEIGGARKEQKVCFDHYTRVINWNRLIFNLRDEPKSRKHRKINCNWRQWNIFKRNEKSWKFFSRVVIVGLWIDLLAMKTFFELNWDEG